MTTFAQRLEELLERGAGNGDKRWNKEKFAAKVGIHSDTLRNWRQGRTVPANSFLLEACVTVLQLDNITSHEFRNLAQKSKKSNTSQQIANTTRSTDLSSPRQRLIRSPEVIGASEDTISDVLSGGHRSPILEKTQTSTIRQIERLWAKSHSEAEVIELCKQVAKHSIIPNLLYLEHLVQIDIANIEGDAKFVFSFKAVNVSDDLVFGESKSIWIENGAVELSIVPTRDSYRKIRVEMRRDYPHMKQFFCAFSNALEPGDQISYGYELMVPKMFTSNHYWDTKINNLTQRVTVRIHHNKGKELMTAHVECEGSSGMEQEAKSNISFETSHGAAIIAWNKVGPRYGSKYSLIWSFEE